MTLPLTTCRGWEYSHTYLINSPKLYEHSVDLLLVFYFNQAGKTHNK